jgi:pimeloyl-ACP methyl ester carboxylesterase
MGRYVQLGEVRTWYEEDSSGPPLVLLHPGGADSRAFEGIIPGLVDRFRVFRPDRRGHGRTPDVAGPITYEQMAKDTIAFLEQVVGGPAYLVGHSDGAPVALLVALRRPDLVRRLVFASGVFHHDGWAPGAIDLDEETTAFFTVYHGAVSPDGPGSFQGAGREAVPDALRGANPHRGRPGRLPRPDPGHGRRRRRRDPHGAHPGPAPGTSAVTARGRARLWPWAVRRQTRSCARRSSWSS